MSDKKKKNYIKSSAKIREFDNGGHIIRVSIHVDSLQAIANEKGYARIEVCKNFDGGEDQYGNTHYIVEDTYMKDKEAGGKKGKKSSTKAFSPSAEDDDLPW